MSITIKSKTDLAKMREAGRIAARALELAGKSIKPGMTTFQLDKIIHDVKELVEYFNTYRKN